jgi:hypothetical protein
VQKSSVNTVPVATTTDCSPTDQAKIKSNNNTNLLNTNNNSNSNY